MCFSPAVQPDAAAASLDLLNVGNSSNIAILRPCRERAARPDTSASGDPFSPGGGGTTPQHEDDWLLED
ncbi:hypothetical protein PBY51_020150 [Eleginops maclovinus]|uniref:Uncharacterized protein n=1 Tax=Eleginops maclovinus TaxID=56733 RepID=A0AAN7XSE3_ELEMC|nr:hypothetical protein PBY51_020150 [Eleginops maclovinus]